MPDAPRRYTTAELAAMPATARLVDRDGRMWFAAMIDKRRRKLWYPITKGHVSTTDYTNSQLARRQLRRIA